MYYACMFYRLNNILIQLWFYVNCLLKKLRGKKKKYALTEFAILIFLFTLPVCLFVSSCGFRLPCGAILYFSIRNTVFLLWIVIVKYITCLCVIEAASQLKAYCFVWWCFKPVRRTSRRNMQLFCFSQLFLLTLLVFSYGFKLLCCHLLSVWRTLPVRFLSFITIYVCDLEASITVQGSLS